MAEFEDTMKELADLGDEERSKKIEEIKKTCKSYCGECPSYSGTGEEDLGFCATGKASRISEERGCLCASCPVTDQLSLRWGYYCTRGSGQEQSEEA